MTIGLAAFSFALAVLRFIDYESGFADQLCSLAVSAILLMLLSAVAGGLWLDRIVRWRRFQSPHEARAGVPWLTARILFPAAIAASLVEFLFVMRVRTAFVPIPDFDRTIETYEHSLAAGFRSNVPSASIEAMLTAYVERAMPAYMWDFGPEGFKLVGGRWQPLRDGTPVTYTWFRGPAGGVICMMREIDAFNLPPGVWEQHDDLFFYKYRGFSVCLINIGGYGHFIAVIASPIPIRQFVALVLRVVN
jgi:hypothetical protein